MSDSKRSRPGLCQNSPDGMIAIIVAPSPPRRWLGIGFLVLCGCLLGITGLTALPTGGLYAGAQLLAAFGSFWAAWRIHAATSHRIELVGDEIRSTDGTLIAHVDNVQRVDISMFAFKPSNGLLLHLLEPMDKRWQPGLWWRFGRRIGIGGCTPKYQARKLAEALEFKMTDNRSA